MILMQVGFIAQLKGTLTKKRYTAATIFIDHSSRLKYIHLMTKLTSKETMEAKQAFKHFAKQHGIRILHYHCDYGQFVDNAFKNSAVQRGSDSPSVGSTPTSKMALQKKPAGTFKRVHGRSSSMRINNGRLPSNWPFGYMPSGAPFTSTILCLFWRMVPQG
jgi:hypothetical protein